MYVKFLKVLCTFDEIILMWLYLRVRPPEDTEGIEPRSEKTGLRGFRPGQTQTRLCSHRRWLEA